MYASFVMKFLYLLYEIYTYAVMLYGSNGTMIIIWLHAHVYVCGTKFVINPLNIE